MKSLIFIALTFFYLPLSSAQDIVVNRITLPESLTICQTVAIEIETGNSGTEDIDLLFLRLLLSADSVLDESDEELGYLYLNALKAGSTNVVDYSLNTGTLPGELYLFAVADPDDLISEENETNNIRRQAFSPENIEIDLSPQSLTIDREDFSTYEMIMGTLSLATSSTGTINYSTHVRFYYSKDGELDENDVILSNYSMPVDNSKLTSLTKRINIKGEVPAGSGYLICQVDPDQELDEIDEENNTVSLPIFVSPPAIDLRVLKQENLPLTFDQYAEGGFIVENIGTTDTYLHSIYILYSHDTLPDDEDIYIDKERSEQRFLIEAGSSRGSTFAIDAPSPIPMVGYYNVLVQVNPDTIITETDYNNNIVSLGKLLLTGDFDLHPDSVYFTKDVWPDSDTAPLAIQWKNGDVTVDSLPVQLDIDIYDDQQNLVSSGVWSTQYNNIAPGQIVQTIDTVLFDHPIPPGDYTIVLSHKSYHSILPAGFSTEFQVDDIKLEGYAIGKDGQALSNIHIMLYDPIEAVGSKIIQNRVTNEAGFFSFQVVGGDYYLQAYPLPPNDDYVFSLYGDDGDMYFDPNCLLSIASDTTLYFNIGLKIEPTRGELELEGVVLDQSDKSGRIASLNNGLSLFLLNKNKQVIANDTTNAGGHFKFENLSEGTYYLVIGEGFDIEPAKVELYGVSQSIEVILYADLSVEIVAPSTITSVDDRESRNSLWPNPARSMINLSLDQTTSDSFMIYNSTGTRVMEGELSENGAININELPPGTYRISTDGYSATFIVI